MIEKGKGSIDVVAAAVTEGHASVHILYVRQGRILGSRSYYPKAPLATQPSELLNDFIPLLYLEGGARPDLPKEILLSHEINNADLLSDALKQQIGRAIEIRFSVRGFRAKWLELAQRTAEQNLSAKLASKKTQEQRFDALRETLDLDDAPQRWSVLILAIAAVRRQLPAAWFLTLAALLKLIIAALILRISSRAMTMRRWHKPLNDALLGLRKVRVKFLIFC